MALTLLIENTGGDARLRTQHGLSLWIEAGNTRIIVGTGQDAAFLANADALGIPAADTDVLVLTHGHYDHTGGVPALLGTGARPAMAIHPRAWEARRSMAPGKPVRSVGVPWERSLLETHGLPVHEAPGAAELLPGIRSTGSIPNVTGTTPGPKLQRESEGGWVPDAFPDEHALVLTAEAGLVVVTGCCHTGVENTLRAAKAATGIDRIHALIGGLHLLRASEEEVTAVAEAIRTQGVQQVWVNHCTGEDACARLRDELGRGVLWAGTGFRAELPSA